MLPEQGSATTPQAGAVDLSSGKNKAKGLQVTVPSDKEPEPANPPSTTNTPQPRTAKSGTAQRPNGPFTPQASPPSTPLARSTSAENEGNDDEGDSERPSSSKRPSQASPRTLGPRSWIVACARINDAIVDDLSRLCALKGQFQELLYLSSQLVPSPRFWGNWVSPSKAAENGVGEEDFDFAYNKNLDRLAAQPDLLVAELRALQRELAATVPSRRGSVDPDTTGANVSAAAAAGTTDVELERLRGRWTSLTKRVILLSKRLNEIIQIAAEACRRSGAHPGRPALVAMLKKRVEEAQPDFWQMKLFTAGYEMLPLHKVLEDDYPQGRPEPPPELKKKMMMMEKTTISPSAALITAEALRRVPIPQSVSEMTGKVMRDLRGATGSVSEELAWIPRTLGLSRPLVYYSWIYLASMMVTLPLSFYYFDAPPEIWV